MCFLKVYEVNVFNLSFKKIFHTIVPQFDDSNSEEGSVVDLLRRTYENIFCKLEESKLDSIAITLLGENLYASKLNNLIFFNFQGCELHVKESIRALCLALDKFLKRYIRKRHNYLRFIQIINAPKENLELLNFFLDKINSRSKH